MDVSASSCLGGIKPSLATPLIGNPECVFFSLLCSI